MDGAMERLSSLITGRRAPVGETYDSAFRAMATYLRVLGIAEATQALSVIHVAGTKGKGSTCAFVERILRGAGVRTGLFTSPHLIDVRERIRLDGELVPEDLFLKEFDYCWNQLTRASENDSIPMPAYFRFLTLLGLRIFLQTDVQVVILEVGLGGRLDATNIIEQPMVCGITSIGYDHEEILGNTLTQIAQEKAGILKTGVEAYTIPQKEEAMASLQRCANRVGVELEIAKSLDKYQGPRPALGLDGAHQEENAALAMALCQSWYRNHRKKFPAYSNMMLDAADRSFQANSIPKVYLQGLAQAFWPGRSQIVVADRNLNPIDSKCADPDGTVTFFLDGAHTPESMAICAGWFADSGQQAGNGDYAQGRITDNTLNVLVFNCMQEREPAKLLKPMAHSRAVFNHAIFVPNDSSFMSVGKKASSVNVSAPLSQRDTAWQQKCAHTWSSLFQSHNSAAQTSSTAGHDSEDGTRKRPEHHGGDAEVISALSLAMERIRKMARSRRRTHVLVTGSLHLVGDILRLLRGKVA